MANTIRIKKRAASGSAGAPSSLSPSELAFNENDLKLYYGFGDNGATPPEASSIITIGGSGAFVSKTATQNANIVLAGPTTGSAAAPTFRSLVAADIPSIAHTKISDFDSGVQANRVDELADATNPVTGVTPTADAHFATKGYVDGVAQGLDIKEAVKVASTGNLTLSGTQTIDNVAVSADQRVLVKDQSTASQNGIYLCKAGSWTRTDDLATGADASSVFVFVSEGDTNADNSFVCTDNKGSAVVGTNNLTFTQFSGAGNPIAGDGISKNGNIISADLKANGGLVIESSEIALKLDASSITGTLAISDGGTGATSASAARTALGLAIGTNVQAFDAQLSDIAGLTPTDGNFIVGDGSNFVLESGSTARASLGAQASAADLTSLSSCQTGGAAALAALTATEIQILDGATVSTAELNILDGVTATTSELNIIDGVTATTAELNIMDGVTATTAELNIMDGVTSTTAELNILDGVTSTASELNILDGLTATTTEINTACDGNTSATSTTLATADRFVCNDAGTIKQVALSDLVTFLEDGATSGFNVDGGTY
tara:strand:- start:1403 stop:3052 length:1650 start_codon:yes stop_codon:yes gene_type:complete